MATFNITTNGTTASQALSSAPAALFLGGVFDGAKVTIEVSPDDTTFAPLSASQELNSAYHKAPSCGQLTLPSGWHVRCRTSDVTPNTSILVVIA